LKNYLRDSKHGSKARCNMGMKHSLSGASTDWLISILKIPGLFKEGTGAEWVFGTREINRRMKWEDLQSQIVKRYRKKKGESLSREEFRKGKGGGGVCNG